MTTLDIEIAVIKGFKPRQNLIVPNVSWGIWDKYYGALHECDVLILSKSGYATEVEIKANKSDLVKDSEKHHNHIHGLIRRFYFAVPEKLKDFALANIPERAGLYVLKVVERTRYNWDTGGCAEETYSTNILECVKECKINTKAVKWSNEDKYKLARLGAMRILGLKQKINKLLNEKT
jgi:hypothetical protein